MKLTFASYNIRKAVGLDRRRDPDRILSILHEVNADVVALQEADRRFGRRQSVLPMDLLDDVSHYRAVPLGGRSASMGWHGNAMLVRRDFEILDIGAVELPTIEPRGAIRVDLGIGGHRVRVVGMHLDLSGLRRRHQLQAVLAHLSDCDGECPTVLMGDLNEWSRQGGSLRAFQHPWRVLAPGRSFPSRRPVAQLDRIVISPEWHLDRCAVHHSALASVGSDHLPVWASLELRGG